MSPTPDDRPEPEDMRARLLMAARAVFAEHAYSATVTQICEAAHTGIGTFVEQFTDKREIMRVVMLEQNAAHLELIDGLDADRLADLAPLLLPPSMEQTRAC